MAATISMAAKCFTHEPAFDVPADDGGGAGQGGAGAQSGGGAGAAGGPGEMGGAGGSSFRPAVACNEAGSARLDVVQRSFVIRCGCAEADGKVCTIPTHTTVTWTFLDSEEHNVTSVFGDSPDKLSGTYKRSFESPGDFPYACGIHAAMNGYRIVVIEP